MSLALGCSVGDSGATISAGFDLTATPGGATSSTPTSDGSGSDQTASGATDDPTGAAADGASSTSGDSTGCTPSTWYPDADADGHGDPEQPRSACEPPVGYVMTNDDCDDTDPDNSPSLEETCDGRDNDCDTLIDEVSAGNTACNGCALGENGDSYYAYCPAPLVFDAARAQCASFGGDLVKIEDRAENGFLAGQALPPPEGPGNFLIGLSDQAVEGQFVWTDGAAPTFTSWGEGEPNNAGDDEHCVEFGAGAWNDVPCGVARAFICEASPAGAD